MAISLLFGTSSYQPVPQVQPTIVEQSVQKPAVRPSSAVNYSGTQIAEETVRMLINTAPTASLLSPEKRDEVFETLKCESKFFTQSKGDFASTTQKYTSFGIPQIHLPAHPDITLEQAYDPVFSIQWTVEQFVEHREYMWTCWKNLYDK